MVANGKFHNGVVVVDDPSRFREGQDVEVRPCDEQPEWKESDGPDLSTPYARKIHEWLKTRKPMPPDQAEDWMRASAIADAQSWEGVDDDEADRRWAKVEAEWGKQPERQAYKRAGGKG